VKFSNSKEPTMSADEKPAVFSIQEWCFASRISPALFFKEQRNGRGPRTANAGRRTLVLESPLDYYSRVAQEAEAAQSPVEPASA
jgi:hypothetical protein